MLRPAICFAALLAASGAVAAERPVRVAAEPAVNRLVVPGTGYAIEPGASQRAPGSRFPRRALIAAIAKWVAAEVGLPAAEAPEIRFAAPRALVAMLYEDAPRGARRPGQPKAATGGPMRPQIVALYRDSSRTMILPEGWTGGTPAELSIVVHEMVHHLQNAAGQRFACREERERAAYEAQARWLAMFGRDLYRDFAIDPLTRLVRTTCGL